MTVRGMFERHRMYDNEVIGVGYPTLHYGMCICISPIGINSAAIPRRDQVHVGLADN